MATLAAACARSDGARAGGRARSSAPVERVDAIADGGPNDGIFPVSAGRSTSTPARS